MPLKFNPNPIAFFDVWLGIIAEIKSTEAEFSKAEFGSQKYKELEETLGVLKTNRQICERSKRKPKPNLQQQNSMWEVTAP